MEIDGTVTGLIQGDAGLFLTQLAGVATPIVLAVSQARSLVKADFTGMRDHMTVLQLQPAVLADGGRSV